MYTPLKDALLSRGVVGKVVIINKRPIMDGWFWVLNSHIHYTSYLAHTLDYRIYKELPLALAVQYVVGRLFALLRKI